MTPPFGKLMPERAKAWAKLAEQIESQLAGLGRGESLDIRIFDDPRRGLIISKFGKAWTPRDNEAA